MSLKFFAALLITTVNAEQLFATEENHRFLRAPDHSTTEADSVPVNPVS